ncbi:unnamed protein product [Adineta steineri]|uniref:Uncharacterized protein n=1 Tax=Adineta steineri TaxID=433720 RepID=A0A815AL39_9BILA|nr:unnamed protein product [Adineta steineri]CAF1154157.1 unnamed protein product [Adineta steineri]CAF1258941.1 unnamed protein product [Adineta steineri]CAF3603771.1 unnamed protein product [Adineta steineri]CAF3607111.1 unnamed protein product [Adineta steineri]
MTPINNRHQFYRWFIDYEFKNTNVKIYTTYGVHPKYLPTNTEKVGIGECGLDDTGNYPFELQVIVFKK